MAKASPPSPFLESVSVEPKRDFVSFIAEMEEFFELSSITENKKKLTWLSYSLGIEGKRVAKSALSKVTTETKYADLVTELKSIFYIKPSKTVARYIFGRRQQQEGETPMNFITTLQRLALDCEYKGEAEEENICDRFVIGLSTEYSELRSKLLEEENLTMKVVKDKVLSFTANREQTRELDRASSQANAFKVDAVTARMDSNARWSTPAGPGGRGRGPPRCFNCGKLGHFQSVCRSYPQAQAQNSNHPNLHRGRGGQGRGAGPARPVRTIGVEEMEDEASGFRSNVVEVGPSVNAVTNSKIFVDVDIEQKHEQQTQSPKKKCRMQVDSGSGFTIISKTVADELGLHLTKCLIPLSGYTGQRLDIYGQAAVDIKFGGQERKCTIIVVKEGQSLLGLEEIIALQVDVLKIGKFPRVNQTVKSPSVESGQTQEKGVPEAVDGSERETVKRPTGTAVNGGGSVIERREVISVQGQFEKPRQSIQKTKQPDVDMSDVCQETDKVFVGVGRAIGYMHKIRLKEGAIPRLHKPRPIPLAMAEKHAANLQKLEESGIIRPIKTSLWSSPFTCVWKKGTDKVRSTLDLRYLNSQIVEQKYPLPNIEQFLQRFHGKDLFTTVDLSMAYHQLPLHPDSRELTAFQTPKGMKCYVTCPFGLCSGGAFCQEVIEDVVAATKRKHSAIAEIGPYLDDIIIATTGGIRMHKLVVHDVLTAVFEAGLTLSYEKCFFGRREVAFLGHVISANGIAPGKANTQAIMDAQRPEDQRQLKSFIGLVGFFSRFVEGWADIVGPLYDVANAMRWHWTDQAENSFQKAKQALAAATERRLRFFRPGGKTALICDASATMICAVLAQKHDVNGGKVNNGERHSCSDDWQPIAFYSRRLKGRELNFSVGEKELIAVIEGCERNHHLLYGSEFEVQTDHRSLVSLLKPSSVLRVTQRMSRWADRLMRYNFRVVYIPTASNPADAFTRLPTNSQDLAEMLDMDAEEDLVVTVAVTQLPDDDGQELLRRYITNGWPASKKDIPDEELRAVKDVEREMWLDSQQKVRRGEDGVWVPPVKVRNEVLKLAHEGHPGKTRMISLARRWAWWPGMTSDINRFCNRCLRCAAADKTHKSHHTRGTEPVLVPDGPWKVLAFDVVGPMSAQPRYILTLIDVFSKWPEIASGNNAPTTRDVTAFLRTVFARFGAPETLKTDNASILVSAEMTLFLKQYGVKHHKVTPYNSRSNGVVERFNSVVMDAYRMAVEDGQTGAAVSDSLTTFLGQYRVTPHSTTDSSPAMLLLKRELRCPLAALTGANIHRATEEAATVCERVSGKQAVYRKGTTKFEVGQRVMVKKTTFVPKGRSRFYGPMRITHRHGQVTYELENGEIVNARRLSAHHGEDHSNKQLPDPSQSVIHPQSHHPTCDDGARALVYDDDDDDEREDDQDRNQHELRRSMRTTRQPERYGDVRQWDDVDSDESESGEGV